MDRRVAADIKPVTAAGKPVVIDDGGSIRIREMQDGVQMDGLISPPVAGSPIVSNQNFGTGAQFQCTLSVRYMDEAGMFTALPQSGNKYGLVLVQTDTITITASKKHTATITFDANGFLNILLSVGADSMQEETRRRYILTNSGSIKTVTQLGVATPVFDGTGIPRAFTMVHFSPGKPTNQLVHKIHIRPGT